MVQRWIRVGRTGQDESLKKLSIYPGSQPDSRRIEPLRQYRAHAVIALTQTGKSFTSRIAKRIGTLQDDSSQLTGEKQHRM